MARFDLMKARQMADDELPTAGSAGYVSWGRLQDVLRHSGDLGPGEVITEVYVNGKGIQFQVKRFK